MKNNGKYTALIYIIKKGQLTHSCLNEPLLSGRLREWARNIVTILKDDYANENGSIRRSVRLSKAQHIISHFVVF